MPKILVVMDPDETQHSALNRIKETPIGQSHFKVVYYLSQTVTLENAHSFLKVLKEKKNWLANIVQPLVDEGHDIETEVKLFYRLYEAIICSAYEFEADFIFKPLRQHSSLRRALFTSTDWNLIRFCPCPLLLVNGSDTLGGSSVLAAIDLAGRNSAHENLNRIILEHAGLIAELLGSTVHMVNAYSSVSVPTGSVAFPDPSTYQIIQSKRDLLLERGFSLAAEVGIPEDKVHLCEGAESLVISECAQEVDAGIIVIGTVARSGMAGLFIGNTAERVVECAECDVFVVKPLGFVSPITPASLETDSAMINPRHSAA